jgi:class 3 adenylate cyclase
MTSHGSEVIAVEVFRKGVRDYVIKPFTSSEMLATMERALTEVRLQREKEALTARLMQANRQLKKRLRELDTLSRIGKSVTALMERDKLLHRVVDAALYVTGAEEGAILLEDEDLATLREYVRKRRVKGAERLVSRRTEDELAADAMCKGDAVRTGPMLSIPLKVGGAPTGVLCVSNKVTARSFSDHDLRLLMALADYAAIAIANTRLLQRVEEAKEREKQQIRGLFERYVAPSVVEKLMVRPDAVALGGIRQRVTVLFADIRGFSSFSSRVTPEVLVRILNHHMALAAEAIMAERGTLDKFLGDAVMAYFNAPLPQPDHALRAVRAAWRICQAVAESHDQLPSAHQLQFGVGVSAGEVLVGNIGAPQLMSFTVIGDAVNVSRRLQERARGGQILVCQQVYRQVRGYVEARSVGELKLKGCPQPMPAFEVVAVHV